MYEHWGIPGKGRALLLVIAVVSVGVLWLGAGGSEVRPSGWRLPGSSAPATDGRVAGRLSGFAAGQQGRGLPGVVRPQGNPLQAPNTVMTQTYGVGTHAPAEIWGAIDLAIDGDGDGAADPDGSWNQPIYATHGGAVKVTPNSHPAGNHVWVTNDEYRTGYSHLASFAVEDGEWVERGDLIGYMGSTGMSSGPHLDYQIWMLQGGVWVNVNPLDFGALDGAP